jgi:hypothetical protein
MHSLEEMGVPRFTAQRSVLEKYGLRRLPDIGATSRQRRNGEGVQWVIDLHRWPRTKAAWIRAMWWQNVPTFPLAAAAVDAIPPDVTGPLPTQVEDLAFGRPVHVDMKDISAIEHAIRTADGPSLWQQRRACTAGGRGHLWIQLRSITYARGAELYCGNCLLLKLRGFLGWPIEPVRMDTESRMSTSEEGALPGVTN